MMDGAVPLLYRLIAAGEIFGLCVFDSRKGLPRLDRSGQRRRRVFLEGVIVLWSRRAVESAGGRGGALKAVVGRQSPALLCSLLDTRGGTRRHLPLPALHRDAETDSGLKRVKCCDRGADENRKEFSRLGATLDTSERQY